MSFSETVREKALLWCDRHCCVCGKQCGIMIELHHIDPRAADGADTIENVLPVCFECHCHIQHYNNDHPRGSKFKPSELKKRRDQIYELHTARYLPPVPVLLTQSRHIFPEIGFCIGHAGGPFPVSARVKISHEESGCVVDSEYYNESRPWNLNPGSKIHGHFLSPSLRLPITLRLDLSLIDTVERLHRLLPVAYTLPNESGEWYLEPSPMMGECARSETRIHPTDLTSS